MTRKIQPTTYPYKIKDKELTTTSVEKDLGIWVASDLTWTKHVLERCAKANKLLGFVRRSGGEISNSRTRRKMYLSVVRPVFGYASQVWSPQTIGLVFFFQAVNGLIDVSKDVLPQPIIPTQVTRSSSTTELLFRPQKCRTTTFQKSYFTRATRVWNCLPTNLRQPNMLLSTFKRLLRNYYLEALHSCYDAEDPKTWKSVCLNCNSCRSLNSVI